MSFNQNIRFKGKHLPGQLLKNNLIHEVSDSNVRAFNSSHPRFINSLQKKSQQIPGPGSYNPDQFKYIDPYIDKIKKVIPLGTNAKRTSVLDCSSDYPGPGSYLQQQSSFSTNKTNLTIKPKIQHSNLKQQQQETPGPGHYKLQQNKKKNNGFSHFFKKQQHKRLRKKCNNAWIQQSNKQIEQMQKLQKEKKKIQSDIKVLNSRVKPNIYKEIIDYTMKYLPKQQVQPTYYNLKKPQFLPKYLLLKNTFSFTNSNKQLKRPQLFPGPGNYQLPSSFKKTKRRIENSFFKSDSARLIFAQKQMIEKKGPNTKQLPFIGKKQFLLNPSGKWV